MGSPPNYPQVIEIQFITCLIVLNFRKDILANATKSKVVELLISGWAGSSCSIAVIRNLFLPLDFRALLCPALVSWPYR